MLFEGSPTKSANLKAVVELKLMPAAINQCTPAIEYSPLTGSLAPFSNLISLAATLTV